MSGVCRIVECCDEAISCCPTRGLLRKSARNDEYNIVKLVSISKSADRASLCAVEQAEGCLFYFETGSNQSAWA
jgi:hypothetical protein